MTTRLKNIKFTMLKALHTKSLEKKLDGDIRSRHVQTPNAQYMLISSDDFLFTIRAISGIFHKGRMIAIKNAIL